MDLEIYKLFRDPFFYYAIYKKLIDNFVYQK